MTKKPHAPDSYAVFNGIYERVNALSASLMAEKPRKDMDSLTRAFTDNACENVLLAVSLRDAVFTASGTTRLDTGHIRHYEHLQFGSPEKGKIGSLQGKLVEGMIGLVDDLKTMQQTELANDIEKFVEACVPQATAVVANLGRAQKNQPAPAASIM